MTAMISHVPRRRTETVRIREQASELLSELLAQRDMLEVSLEEGGRRDQMKSITGRSALDNAILSTRRIIQSIDRLLESADAPGPVGFSVARVRDHHAVGA